MRALPSEGKAIQPSTLRWELVWGFFLTLFSSNGINKSDSIRPNSSSLNSEGAPHKYTKHVIKDPFNNRKDIAKVAKNAVGVYIFVFHNVEDPVLQIFQICKKICLISKNLEQK